MRERTGDRRSLDVEELVSRRAVLAGAVEAESLPRLLEVVTARPRAVAYRIEFTRDVSGRPKMSGHVEGVLPLVCQRCLDRFDWSFDTRFESVVVGNAQEDTGGMDAVTCSGGRIDLNPVIEDEILLALPNAPVHPRGSCDAPSFRAARGQPSSRRSSPFSALRTLWSNHGREQSD
ncbi:MAG: YceD family protein [Chromatiales bacterium]|nr:YceD family protein [Chromatiales bacterium]